MYINVCGKRWVGGGSVRKEEGLCIWKECKGGAEGGMCSGTCQRILNISYESKHVGIFEQDQTRKTTWIGLSKKKGNRTDPM